MTTSDLALALSIADAADEITMRYFRRSDLAVRAKQDQSPVSEADEAAERAIRATLAKERPSDGILGEEFGGVGSAARRWIIDPIDATANYVRGVPVFGTLIALEENGVLTTGVVSAPALHRRWAASRGHGAHCNGLPIHVSKVDKLGDAFVSSESRLSGVARIRNFGDFWMHMLVAEGAIDAAIDPRVSHWDMAAVQIIVEEAGGKFTDLEGRARADGGSGLSTNGLIHDAILKWSGGL